MSDSTGSIVKHNLSGITTGSYNKIIVDKFGHITAGSVVEFFSTNISGSSVMSDSTGSIVKHNLSGITTGSYNKVSVDIFGHIVSGSVIESSSTNISGSGIMSTTTGSIVKHNVSGATSGSYLSANVTIDSYGHITTIANGVSASSVGAPSDSPFVTSASATNLTNYRILTAGSNIQIDKVAGSIIIHSISSSSGSLNLWNPDVPGISPDSKDDEFDNSSLDGKWSVYGIGSYTITEESYGLSIFGHNNGDSNEGIYQAVPFSDWTVYAKISMLDPKLDYCLAGIGLLTDGGSSASPIYTAGIFSFESTCGYKITTWSDSNNWNADNWSGIVDFLNTNIYVRVRYKYSTTTAYFDFSTDGLGWRNVYALDLTGIPIQHIGLIFDMNNASEDGRGVFSFFRYKPSFDETTTVTLGKRV